MKRLNNNILHCSQGTHSPFCECTSLLWQNTSHNLTFGTTTECGAGWRGPLLGDRCFKYNAIKRNYADSVKYCKSQSGNIASIRNAAENNFALKLIKARVTYIGAESDGKGNWRWNDGSKWWQPSKTGPKNPNDDDGIVSRGHDGLVGRGETKITLNPVDKMWHDWGTGSEKLSVLCAKDRALGICTLAKLGTHCNHALVTHARPPCYFACRSRNYRY